MSSIDIEARLAKLEAALPDMVPLAALTIFASDPHQFSTRGCGTCRDISAVIGKPWGCVALANRARSK